jgi:hypothetical protein
MVMACYLLSLLYFSCDEYMHVDSFVGILFLTSQLLLRSTYMQHGALSSLFWVDGDAACLSAKQLLGSPVSGFLHTVRNLCAERDLGWRKFRY